MAARIRRVTLSDLPVLVAHRRGMWEAMGRLEKGQHDFSEAAYRRWLKRRLVSRELFGYACVEGDAILATGLVWLQPSQPRPHLPALKIPYVLSVFTEPRARGKGLARRIMQRIIAWARANGYRRVSLHASDAGRPIYERLGFKPSPEMWLELRRRMAR